MNLLLGTVLALALATAPPTREEPAAQPGAELQHDAELTVSPHVQQGVLMFLSDQVTAGGLAAGAGVQLVWRHRYVAQIDFSALWGIGNTWSSRFALGIQHDGFWAPAVWATTTVLLGDRLELLTEDGRRPPAPTWGIGLRASPLRFISGSAFFSALEPSLATNLGGGALFDLTLVQIGAHW